MVKSFLVLKVWKLGFFIAPIFGIYLDFLDFLFLNKFTTISLALLSLSPTTSLLSALNAFEANFDNQIVFNKEVNDALIMTKP